MKIEKIHVRNIGLVTDETLELNCPLILLVGRIRQGKSTFLNAFRWCIGASWPDDILQHGKQEGSIELSFAGGSISRSWYRSKAGKTIARDIQFVKDGKPVKNPSTVLKNTLLGNPFLTNQDHLKEMGEAARKAFFAELFAVDTTELDKEWSANDSASSRMRIEIKSYGDIDLTEIKQVDSQALKRELGQIRADWIVKKAELEKELQMLADGYASGCDIVEQANEAIRQHNANCDSLKRQESAISQLIEETENQIDELQKRVVKLKHELAAIMVPGKKELRPKPEFPTATRIEIQKRIASEQPDTSALESSIQDAAATNVRHEQYLANKKRHEERKEKEKELSKLEARQREIKAEKTAKLATVTAETGIKDLAFDEDGNFTYQGTSAGMLSTSQLITLSKELSSLYPEGLGIELLDRAESLGESIFTFIEKAKANDSTILAAIVGEKPAATPDGVGVFVVENGKLSEQKNLEL